METIKTSPNVEFDVIYADGTRAHVPEGVLFGVEPSGEMILHNGTDCPAVWFTVAETMLVALNGCDAIPAFVRRALLQADSFAAVKAMAEVVDGLIVLPKPAVFRLGQMDFQQCAADMLEDAAKEANGLVASTLLHAAALVRDMKVPGGANEG